MRILAALAIAIFAGKAMRIDHRSSAVAQRREREDLREKRQNQGRGLRCLTLRQIGQTDGQRTLP